MSYSQATLVSLLSSGALPDESGPPEHIETVISNVFLFAERAYKLYKNDNDFFNKTFKDLSDKSSRIAFTREDFEWNHQLAGEVYLRLQGVRVHNGAVEFTDSVDEAEELLQVTKRLPAGTILFDQLGSGLAPDHYRSMGKQFGEREKNFKFTGVWPDETTLENMLGRHADIDEWLKSVEQHIPAAERVSYTRELKKRIEDVYSDPDAPALAVCFDSHSLNAFYVDGALYPFDTYSPKEAWRFGPRLLNVYRTAADILALAGEWEFEAFMEGYRAAVHSEAPSEAVERLMLIYASLIMVPYLYMLGQSDATKLAAAARYHAFLKSYTRI